MKARIGPLCKLDCLYWMKKKFSVNKQQILNLFLGWADTEPSSPITNNLGAQQIRKVEGSIPDAAIRSNK